MVERYFNCACKARESHKNQHQLANLQAIVQFLAADPAAMADPAIVQMALQSIDRGLVQLRASLDAAHGGAA